MRTSLRYAIRCTLICLEHVPSLDFLCCRFFQLVSPVREQLLGLRLMFSRKEPVHVLKRKALRLWVEDIYDGQPECVQYGKDNVGLPSNIRDCWGCEFYDCEVADPIRRC